MFRRDVLNRYLQEPTRFRVAHGQVGCAGLWSLNFDELHDDKLSVFLGDLALMPRKEQHHWRGFNLPEQGRISDVRYQTAILGEWPTVSTPDPPNDLREALQAAADAGRRFLGEPLWRPLDAADQHLADGLHIPVTNEPKELDTQIQAMAKMIGDSINVQAIKRHSGLVIEKAIKGSLDLLHAWMVHLGLEAAAVETAMAPLRLLQRLRSQGAAHRRGSDYEALLRREGLETLTNIERVRRVMSAVTRSLVELTGMLGGIRPSDEQT